MRRWVVIVVAACGANPGKDTKPISNNGSAAVSQAKKNSCEGAARLLITERGFGAIPGKSQPAARKGGEAEIVAACVDDQWEPAALDCMATRASPASCLGQLSAFQEGSYESHLANWEMNWTKGPGAGMGGDMYGGGMYGGAGNPCGGYGAGGAAPEWVACEIGEHVAELEPQIKPKDADHDYAVSVRKQAVQTACETRWPNDDKKCFNAAKDAASLAACRAKLDDGAKNALDNTLADAKAKLDKLQALEKNPKAIECKAVSLAHYSDDAWRGKMVSLSKDERKRVITESRDKLTKSCTDDKWTPVVRACLIGTTKREYDMMDCFIDDKANAQLYKWGFPATGVQFKTGVLECDQLGDLVKKISTCDKIEKDVRDQLVDSFGAQMGSWIDSFSGRDEMAKSCKEYMTMYTEGAKSRGCTL